MTTPTTNTSPAREAQERNAFVIDKGSRNRPPEISQETAREMLNEAQRFSAKYEGEKALTLGTGQASRSLHAFRKLIARAEAELGGKP